MRRTNVVLQSLIKQSGFSYPKIGKLMEIEGAKMFPGKKISTSKMAIWNWIKRSAEPDLETKKVLAHVLRMLTGEKTSHLEIFANDSYRIAPEFKVDLSKDPIKFAHEVWESLTLKEQRWIAGHIQQSLPNFQKRSLQADFRRMRDVLIHARVDFPWKGIDDMSDDEYCFVSDMDSELYALVLRDEESLSI